MITEGLYDRGYLIEFEEGDISLQRTFLYYPKSVYDKYHVVTEGDTLLTIAQKYYNNQASWFVIADVNSELIDDIFELVVGTSLVIPDLNILFSAYE